MKIELKQIACIFVGSGSVYYYSQWMLHLIYSENNDDRGVYALAATLAVVGFVLAIVAYHGYENAIRRRESARYKRDEALFRSMLFVLGYDIGRERRQRKVREGVQE